MILAVLMMESFLIKVVDMNKYKSIAQDLFKNNKINQFALEYLVEISDDGLDDSLFQEAVDDMLIATSLGVTSKEDFRVFFYIDHFCEDLVDEIFGVSLNESEEDDLKRFMFGLKDKVDFSNLLSYRVAILKWLQDKGKLEKEAFFGQHTRQNATPIKYLNKYNLENWAILVNLINKMLSLGIDRKRALIEASNKIEDNQERLNFLSWYNFKFGKDKIKYDVSSSQESDMSNRKFAGIYEDAAQYYIPKEHFGSGVSNTSPESLITPVEELNSKKEKEQDLEAARAKMLSRTFAIDKLLQKHHKTLGIEQVDKIEDALNSLRKQIRKLTLASMFTDCMIRTASIVESNGFQEGGDVLRKIAVDGLVPGQSTGEDSLNKLLEQLGNVSTFLKQREIVRELAEADLLLYELNLASLFPELTEASSKLIDAFSYAGNKVDDIIPKIRGAADNLSSGNVRQEPEEEEEEVPLNLPNKEELDFEQPDEMGVPEEATDDDELGLDDIELNLEKPSKPEGEISRMPPAEMPDSPDIVEEEEEKPKALVDLEKAVEGR